MTDDSQTKWMNEADDLLLQQFFSEASRQQIADDGFSRKVMRQLPSRINWFTRLWTAFCILVFVVLFVAFDGWSMLAVQLEVLVRTMAVQPFSINLLMLASVLFGLLFVGAGEVCLKEQ